MVALVACVSPEDLASCCLTGLCKGAAGGKTKRSRVLWKWLPHLSLLSHLHVFINVNAFWGCLEMGTPPGISSHCLLCRNSQNKLIGKTWMPSHTAVRLLRVREWRSTTLESLYRSSNNSWSPHTCPHPTRTNTAGRPSNRFPLSPLTSSDHAYLFSWNQTRGFEGCSGLETIEALGWTGPKWVSNPR